MSKVEHIIISHETFWQALRVDATTYALALALILPGHWLGSAAMEWVGFIVFFITLTSKAIAERVTIDQARARLDEIEADRARCPANAAT